MLRIKGYLGSMLLGAAMLAPVLTSGCAAHARYYDDYRADYHPCRRMRVVSCFCPAGRRPRRFVRALCALISRRLLRLWPRLSWPNIERIRKLASLRFHRPAAIWIFDRSALWFRSTGEQPIQSI